MGKRFLGVFLASLLIVTGFTALDAPEVAYASSSQESIGRAQIIADTNAARKAAGKPPLKGNTAMDAVAQAWAKKMADSKSMTHNPDFSRQIPSGWNQAGENVAAGYKDIAVTNAWMNSPGHKANILADYSDIGIGYFIDARGFAWSVQNFARYKQPVVQVPPTVPTNLNISNIAEKSFLVSWTPSKTNPSTITYKLSLYKADGKLVSTRNIRSNSTTFNGLEPNTNYKVTISAQTSYYESALASKTAKTATPKPTVPASPQNLSLTPVGANKATVKWTAPTTQTPPTHYVLSLYNSLTKKTNTVTVLSNVTSYTFSNITLGSYYSVKVSAKNAIGNSAAVGSPAVKNKTAPLTATIASATATGNKATITWKAPTKGDLPTHYIVEKYDVKTKKTVSVTVTSSARSYTFTNIPAGSSFVLKITAKNEIGNSTKAQSATLKTAIKK